MRVNDISHLFDSMAGFHSVGTETDDYRQWAPPAAIAFWYSRSE